MRQPSDLDSVVETILVDAYGDDEQYTAFLTVIEEETRLPAAATLLGAPVTVTGFDYTNEARGLVAICKGSNGTGEVALADLAFRRTRLRPGFTPRIATTSVYSRSRPGHARTGPGRTEPNLTVGRRRRQAAH